MTNKIQLLATFMRKIGCSYETATNGLEAWEKYKTSSGGFDYVLMGAFPTVPSPLYTLSHQKQHTNEYNRHLHASNGWHCFVKQNPRIRRTARSRPDSNNGSHRRSIQHNAAAGVRSGDRRLPCETTFSSRLETNYEYCMIVDIGTMD